MNQRKPVLKDPLYRDIVAGLTGHLDPGVFEHCMGHLLREEFPGLAPVPGGGDSGWDGAIPQGGGEPCALVCTTEERVLRNLTRSLNSLSKDASGSRKVVFATSQALTPKRRQALFQRAREKGFTLLQVIEQQGVADRLYRASFWCKELLGLSGRPSALSAVPRTRRPLLALEPVGRDEELAWLAAAREDRVLSGEPGSGKTFLFYHLIHQRGWDALFLTDSDPGAIANALRDQQPSIVVVDDAHVDPQLLTSLVRLRRENHADFRIVAGTWGGGREEVIEAVGGLPERQVRKLELLTRAEILTVIQQVGVQASDEVLRVLIDQSANKPGLAVTIATLWLKGAWQEVLDGRALSRTLLTTFRYLVGPASDDVLAAFALGGERGMGFQAVADFLRLDLPTVRRTTADLAVAGVLSEVGGDALKVVPPKLRFALLRSVFFPDQGKGPDFRELLERAPDLTSAVAALVAAKHHGARIPDQDLRALLVRAGSQRAWKGLAALSAENAQWVLEHYPGDLCDVAGAALETSPEAAISRLLERAVGENRTTNSWTRHPMRILAEWAREFGSVDGILSRRRLLARSAKKFLLEGGQAAVGIHALCLSLSLGWQGTSRDPGMGSSLTISFGRIPSACFPGMERLWDEIRDSVREINGEGWLHFKNLLWEWMHPQTVSHSPDIPEDERAAMRSFAAKVLSDISSWGRDSPGLRAAMRELAGRLGVDLRIDADPNFEILYPEPALGLAERSAWEEARRSAAKSLGREWANRNPGEVARELLHYETEAQEIGRRWPRLAPEMCEELAEIVGEPETWADAFLDERLAADLIRPFLLRATKLWEHLVIRCLEIGSYRWLATELILESEAPHDDLLARALQQAEELPQIVETLCLQRKVPIPSLRKLFHHSGWETALAAVVGEWCASPREGVREEIRKEWQAAVLRAQTDDHVAEPRDQGLQYWLGVILAGDPELAFGWVMQHLVKGHLLAISEEGPFAMAVSALDSSQRLRILGSLDREAPHNLISLLVGQDAHAYRALLGSESLRLLHLEPLGRIPDRAWMDFGLLALEAGYDPEEIVEAAFGGALSYDGTGVEHWSRWAEAFAALEDDLRSQAKRLAQLGRRAAEEKVGMARVAERQRAIRGF